MASSVSLEDGSLSSAPSGGKCFVCGEIICETGHSVLNTETTLGTPLIEKICEVVGNQCLIYIAEEDKACNICIKLVNHLEEIEYEFFATKNKILDLLKCTYDLRFDEIIEETGSVLCSSDSEEVLENESENGLLETFDAQGDSFLQNEEGISSSKEIVNDGNSCIPKSNSDLELLSHNFTAQCSFSSDELENKVELSLKSQNVDIGINDCSIVSNCDKSQEECNAPYTANDHCYTTKCITPIKSQKDASSSNVVMKNNATHLDSHSSKFEETTLEQQTKSDFTQLETSERNVEGKVFVCEICNFPFSTPFLLSRHKKLHLRSKKKVICPLCDEECYDRTHYLHHRKYKHDIFQGSTCCVCKENFLDYRKLKKHLLISHKIETFECDICGTKFRTYNQFSNHKLYTHGNKECRICGKHIFDAVKLKLHEKRHVWLQSKNLICDVCGRSFKTPGGLSGHKISHTGEYKFCCEFCGKGFMYLMALEEHKGTHTKEERYMCDICGRRFVLYSTLHLHKKWHSDPSPYPCKFCKKRFKFRSVRAIHIRRDHTGENPYKCHYCDAQFFKLASLKSHLSSHTKEFPYNCHICSKGYAQRRALARHMYKSHNDNGFLSEPKQCEYKVVLRPDEYPPCTET